jgi:hypothetical protein
MKIARDELWVAWLHRVYLRPIPTLRNSANSARFRRLFYPRIALMNANRENETRISRIIANSSESIRRDYSCESVEFVSELPLPSFSSRKFALAAP